MNVQQQNPDGSWSDATPIGPQGIVAKVEFAARKRGLNKIANLLAAWDERNLGK